MSLRKWTSEKWVDIANPKKDQMALTLHVVDQKVRKEETILNVCQSAKAKIND